MALSLKDRVRESSTTTGTGTITLVGAYVGFQTFASAVSDGDTVYYTIHNTSPGVETEWEVGLGTFTLSGTTLSRDTILSSSNSGSAVNFSAGTKEVFITQPAEKAVYEDSSNNVTVGGKITVGTGPSADLDVATKGYVDNATSAALHYHDPVRVESPTALTAAYDNGTSGVGATLTNSGTQAALVIDGITMATSDRVLVYQQSNAAHNGVYTVTDIGSGSTNWVLTRSTDTDSYNPSDPDSLGAGDSFYVQEGDTGAGESYVMTTTGTITFGTTNITFSQFAATPQYTGTGNINVTGQVISLTGTVGETNGGTGTNTYTTGDILYSNATDSLAKLAGNTTATAKYLTQTGTGSASAAPTWTALAASATTDTTNASNISSGTLPSGRLSGSYTGITGVGTLTAGTWTATTVGVGYGGTGLASYTVGDIVYADGTTSLAKLAGVATGNALISGGVGAAPSYGKIGLTTHVSGVLPIANGGTNSNTATGAFDNLAPSQTANSGKFLTTNGSTTSWADPTSLYYSTSVKLATTSTGIDVTGTATMDGLTVDGATTINATNNALFGSTESLVFRIDTDDDSTTREINFQHDSDNKQLLKIGESGDISFYEDTGTTPKFFWDASAESLGIGTSSPSDEFQITGADPAIRLDDTSAVGYARLEGLNGSLILQADQGATVANSIIRFDVDGTERARIDSSGNLGLGVTPTATANYTTLDISGTTGSILNLKDDGVRVGSFFNTANDVSIGNFTATGFLGFRTNSTERMRINSSGNVGIGTSSPSYKLDVADGDIRVSNSSAAGMMRIYGNDATAHSSGATAAGAILQLKNTNTGANVYSQIAALDASASNIGQITFVSVSDTTNEGYMAFATRPSGGNITERLRIDSSGNLGLGVTPSAWSDNSAIQIGGWASFAQRNTNGYTLVGGNVYWDGSSYRYKNSSTAALYELQGTTGKHAWLTAASGTADTAISWNQAMTLTSAGELLVGYTSTAGYKMTVGGGGLHINGSNHGSMSSGQQGFTIDYASGVTTLRGRSNSSTTRGQIAFNIIESDNGNDLEAMRITSAGDLLVGTTGNFGAKQNILFDPASTNGLLFAVSSGTFTNNYIYFQNSGGSKIGSVSSNNSSVTYNTTSDYRVKTNVQPMIGALSNVMQLNPVTYDWKPEFAEGSSQGFIAHELQAVVPDCVSGAKDAVDAEGKPVYQGVDTSFLVATLTAAIQEQQAIIESLTARVSALEGN